MALTSSEYREVLIQTEIENKNQDKIIKVFDQLENDLFLGQSEVQPIKWHQFTRIFRLAKGFVEIIVIIFPYIKLIIKMLK